MDLTLCMFVRAKNWYCSPVLTCGLIGLLVRHFYIQFICAHAYCAWHFCWYRRGFAGVTVEFFFLYLCVWQMGDWQTLVLDIAKHLRAQVKVRAPEFTHFISLSSSLRFQLTISLSFTMHPFPDLVPTRTCIFFLSITIITPLHRLPRPKPMLGWVDEGACEWMEIDK